MLRIQTMDFTDRQIQIMETAIARIDKHGIQNLTIKNLAADIGVSEPALYRHFSGKNEILFSLLEYFKSEMKLRIDSIIQRFKDQPENQLKALFNSQLQTFTLKPAIVSVIFAESIFHFDKQLSNKSSEIMSMMHEYVSDNIQKGQAAYKYSKLINASVLTTIILGGMRMAVLKWKLSGHKSNLVEEGNAVLEGILNMVKIKELNG